MSKLQEYFDWKQGVFPCEVFLILDFLLWEHAL